MLRSTIFLFHESSPPTSFFRTARPRLAQRRQKLLMAVYAYQLYEGYLEAICALVNQTDQLACSAWQSLKKEKLLMLKLGCSQNFMYFSIASASVLAYWTLTPNLSAMALTLNFLVIFLDLTNAKQQLRPSLRNVNINYPQIQTNNNDFNYLLCIVYICLIYLSLISHLHNDWHGPSMISTDLFLKDYYLVLIAPIINFSMLKVEKNKDVILQIDRLVKTIPELSQTKKLIFHYLLKTQLLYKEHSTHLKTQIEEFQQIVSSKSYFSLQKCKVMKDWARVSSKWYTYVEGVARLNIDDIKRVQLNSRRQQINVETSSNLFTKQVEKYSQEEIVCNKKYEQYQFQCNKLNERLEKLKQYQNPLSFYNFNSANQSSKKLQKKFHKCQNLQASLVSNLQMLDDKRKFLSVSLNEIKSEYFFLIHHHLEGFRNIALGLTDQSKDKINVKMGASKNFQSGVENLFDEEIERFEHKYGVGQAQEQLLEGLQDTFKNDGQAYVGSDYKLFMDRCQNFKDKKCASVEEGLNLQKNLLKQFQKQRNHFIIIMKQFSEIEKELFKNYGLKNFNKRVEKYFGSNILGIVELCEMIVDNPRRRFEKLTQILMSNDQKLKKILQNKEEEFKKFKKTIKIILDEHEYSRKQLKNLSKMTNEKVSQFKLNVQKSFTHFKKIIQDFTKREKQIDNTFESQVNKIIEFANIQVSHSLISNMLKKEKEGYNKRMLDKLNIDGEIINIVKIDSRYDVLFNEALSPSLFKDFNTLIKKKNYEETKNVMQKKEHQERGFGDRVNDCCGSDSRRTIHKGQVSHEYKGSVVDENGSFRAGDIKILNRGIYFQESSLNPFISKISLMIPIKECLTFNKKVRERNVLSVEVQANMGVITFVLDQADDFHSQLTKKFSARMSVQENDRKQRNSQTSSILKQSSTSEFRATYDNSVLKETNQRRSSLQKNCDQILFKELGEKLKDITILSANFHEIKGGNRDSMGKKSYQYEDNINRFIVKEKLDVRISGALNYIFLDYLWKISFPETPLLKSFNYGQNVRLEITPNAIKMVLKHKKKEEQTLFVRKKFFTEIEKMNQNLMNEIAKFCERDTDMIVEEDEERADDSYILELQSSLQKDEMGSKNEPRLSRMVSAPPSLQIL